jgi:hypothetical protein
MGPVEAMVVLEELGRGIVLEPLAQTFAVSAALGALRQRRGQAAWLPRIASGEALVVLAHQERKARYRLDVCDGPGQRRGAATPSPASRTWSRRRPGRRLRGARQLDGKLALFLVERGAQGVSTRGYLTQDGSRAADVQVRQRARAPWSPPTAWPP